MIISRTPFRVSFFGGGTDYPAWFQEYGGAVLATTINKYCYITCRYLPPFFDHKHRVIYSKIEHAKDIGDIQHPVVREALRFLSINAGVEIHYDADLPARTGLGSSSSFTVGLLHTLYALQGQMPDKMKLAQDAIYIEQEMVGERVGCQDQTLASFGGFNLVEFTCRKNINVKPITISNDRIKTLSKHLMLFFTGFSRTASEIAGEQIKNIPKKVKELETMHQMVNEGVAILNSDDDITNFGGLLHENWFLKRGLSHKITNSSIDEIYETARSAGAIGGKLLGAGGGGFMLIFAHPEKQSAIREKLKGLLFVPFEFESSGSQIIFYQANEPCAL